MINPNCIFCQRPLEFWENFEPNNGPNFYAGEPSSIYQCKHCNSQQNFQMESGERTYYNFQVGPYIFRFHPKYNSFSLGKEPPDEPGNYETILRLETIPDYTPQNMTEQRIKTIIVFS